MKGFIRFCLFVIFVGSFIHASVIFAKENENSLDAEFEEFNEFEEFSDQTKTSEKQTDSPASSQADSKTDSFDEFEEFSDQTQAPPQKNNQIHDEPPAPDSFSLDEEFESSADDKKQAEQPVEKPAEQPKEPTVVQQPEQPQKPPEQPQQPSSDSEFKVSIKSIKYRPNDNGGTVVIEGDGPLSYSTRKNQETGQFIVEISNAKLSNKLKQPLVTKDIGGPYGAIDAYQNEGSTTARVVIQLRNGAGDPVLQAEGNTLLVVGQPGEFGSTAASETQKSGDKKLLDANTLVDFLASNKKYYGEKKSFETVDMDLREFFYKYMTEWSGLNIYFDESIKQTLTIKITNVPWDQILVDILRWKKLGYIRIGDNGLRIASQSDIAKELEDIKKLMESRKELDPLVTKKYYLSYVDVSEQSARIAKYLSKRGVININAQAGIMVISETEDIHRKIELQIRHDDVPPRQVLIEGKIVEVNEKFTRSFGINWGLSGKEFKSGSKQTGSIDMNFGSGLQNSTMNSSFRLGTFDVIGELSASLALFESEGNAKIISSPRIITMNKMAASIVQNTSIPYTDGQATGGTTSGTNTAVMTPKTSFKEVTMSLNVTPQITYEGSIMMKIDFKRDFVPELTNVGSAPSVESRNTQTNIIVKNGQTAVIAGVYQSDTADGSQRVPWISQVPVIGWLFKSSNKSTAKNELMVFITPKILGDFIPADHEAKTEIEQKTETEQKSDFSEF